LWHLLKTEKQLSEYAARALFILPIASTCTVTSEIARAAD